MQINTRTRSTSSNFCCIFLFIYTDILMKINGIVVKLEFAHFRICAFPYFCVCASQCLIRRRVLFTSLNFFWKKNKTKQNGVTKSICAMLRALSIPWLGVDHRCLNCWDIVLIISLFIAWRRSLCFLVAKYKKNRDFTLIHGVRQASWRVENSACWIDHSCTS